jgi:hypothetical protein
MMNIRRRTDSRRREVDIGSKSLVGWERIDPGQRISERARLFATEPAPPDKRTVSRDARCLFRADIHRGGVSRITRAAPRSSVREIVTNRVIGSQEGGSCP